MLGTRQIKKNTSVIVINNQLDAQFLIYIFIFISILYMFRATLCASSGESNESIQHLVYVTLCRWPTYTEWQIPDVVLIHLTLLMMRTRLLETC